MALYSSLYSSITDHFMNLPQSQTNIILVFWLQSRCNKSRCRFLHAGFAPIQDSASQNKTNPQIRVCDHWVFQYFLYVEKCRFLHSWVHSDDDDDDDDDLSWWKKFDGRKKAFTGVGLPSRSNKLYSGTSNGAVRVWDCESGECVKVIKNGAEIGRLIRECSWDFLSLPNGVISWRVNAANGDYESFDLDGRPTGQINALVVSNNLLFAGSDNGVIWIWKGNSEENPKAVALINAYSGSVLSLALAIETQKKRLFSSYADGTIRVWDLETLKCVQTLSGHTDAVISLLFWDDYLYSCSLDKTIKIWSGKQNGSFEAIYTHEEQCGVVSLFGILDDEAKPVLFSSCKDSAIRVYELPSFRLRARAFSRIEDEAIQTGPGLFFLGDRSDY